MKAFGRKATFEIEDKKITYPKLFFEFEVNFDTDSDGNVGHVRFYNLSDQSIGLFKKDTSFILKAGYRDDIGLLLLGIISSSNTSWENTDKITEVIIGDNTSAWLNSTVNQTWRAGINANVVASDIIDIIPLNEGEISLVNNIEYPKGKVFSCTCKEALEEIAEDTETKLHVSRSKIYLRPPDQGTQEIVQLNKNTGLIASPQRINDKDSEGYKVQSLLNYRIEADSIIKIESKTIKGQYRVEKGSHRLSGDDFLTECEVVPA